MLSIEVYVKVHTWKGQNCIKLKRRENKRFVPLRWLSVFGRKKRTFFSILPTSGKIFLRPRNLSVIVLFAPSYAKRGFLFFFLEILKKSEKNRQWRFLKSWLAAREQSDGGTRRGKRKDRNKQ
jgi:hypothetical protein